jgi:autotransporter-associated beta strand protein
MNTMKMAIGSVILAALFWSGGGAFAAERFWTGSLNEYWTVTDNWYNNVAAASWDSVTFDANTVKGYVNVNDLRGVTVLKLASGLTNDIKIVNQAFYMDTVYYPSAVNIASDSRDLTLHNPFYIQYGVIPFTVGAGRMMTFDSAISLQFPGSDETKGVEKKGGGTLVMAYPNTARPWQVRVSEGTLKTTVDSALNTMGVTVSKGATLNLGVTRQTVSSLSGGGTIAGADDDLLYTGVDGSQTISSNKNYLLALAFNKPAPLTVNGVTFTNATTSGTGYSLGGGAYSDYGGIPANTPSYATGSYSNLLLQFYYNVSNPSLTFTNLTVGKRYEAVIFSSQGWGTRAQDIVCMNGGNTNVWRRYDPLQRGYFAYRFTANTTSATIAMSAWTGDTFTWFGATLEDMTGVEAASRGGTLVVDNSTESSFNGTITGKVSLVKSGSGTLSLANGNTYSGSTVISNGTLRGMASIPIVNSGFEYPVVGAFAIMNDTAYFPNGTDGLPGGWFSTRADKTGLSQWTLNPTPVAEGSQTSWLQSYGNVNQLISAPVSGTYTLTFKAAGRPGQGSSSLAVAVDGSAQANWPASAFSATWWTNCTASLSLSAGAHLLTFTNTLDNYDNICVDDVALTIPVAPLSTNTDLSLAGGVLDLSGCTQAVVSVSSVSGLVSNGTLSVTSALYPGGASATGTLACASLIVSEGASVYWDYGTAGADKIAASGTVTLPASATVRVSASGTLPERVTLFECGTVNAPSGVSAWTVIGGKYYSRVIINGNQVQLVSISPGTLIRFF